MGNEAEIGRLRDAAAGASRGAAQARELAAAIEWRRRPLAHRLDPVQHLHTEAVWASAAAITSRIGLDRAVIARVGQASDDLAHARIALEQRAEELDREARVAGRRADALAAAPAGGIG